MRFKGRRGAKKVYLSNRKRQCNQNKPDSGWMTNAVTYFILLFTDIDSIKKKK